jgi:anti-sigma-K factor RskA
LDTKSIIESGILERYVLNLLPLEDARAIDSLRLQFPEIQSEILRIEKTLESIPVQNVDIPKSNLESILSKLDMPNHYSHSKSMLPYGIAASIIIGILALGNVYFYLKNKTTEETLADLKKSTSITTQIITKLQTDITEKESQLNIAFDTAYKKVVLRSTTKESSNAATVFWNKNSGAVYANIENLPKTDTDKQYQLWALKDGKPIDLGVMGDSPNLQQQNTIAKADAFAITIENRGGSPTPTMDQLILLGELYQ